MQWSRADPAHVRAVANAIVALAFCACEAYGSRPSSQGTTPPIHRPFFLEAAISSRICTLAKSSTMASILASMSTSRRCDSATCRLDPRADVRAPEHLHVEAVCVARDGDRPTPTTTVGTTPRTRQALDEPPRQPRSLQRRSNRRRSPGRRELVERELDLLLAGIAALLSGSRSERRRDMVDIALHDACAFRREPSVGSGPRATSFFDRVRATSLLPLAARSAQAAPKID
jgi:hypothetical protein